MSEVQHQKFLNTELRSKSNQDSSGAKYKQHIQNLESKFQEIRNNASIMTQKIEQIKFEKDQSMQTVEALKKELKDGAGHLDELRKQRHLLDLEQIEEKNRYSDLFVKFSGVQEELSQAQNQLGFLQKQQGETEQQLKAERRKAAKLEREWEQFTFCQENFQQNRNSELGSL